MAYPLPDYITPDEYLEIESRADTRHEYFDGRIYAMAGASFNYNFIVSNVTKKVNIFLDGNRAIYSEVI